MLTRDQAQKLAEKILSFSQFPECTVTLSESEEVNVRFANNGVTTSGFTLERTVTVSSTRERKTGTSSTTQTDDDALRAVVRRSEELAELAPPNQEHMPPLGPQQYPAIDKFDPETAQARAPAMIPQIRAVIEAAARHKLVAAGFFERSAAARALANKNGLFAWGRATDARLSTTVRTPEGTSSGWAGQPALRLKEIDGAALAERAVRKCLAWRNPIRLEPGKYTVVLEPTAVGDLLTMLGFAFSARAADEGRSFLSKKGGGNRLGEKLFPEIVTLRSDPFEPRLPSWPWSLDGLPARPITWVHKGVVENLYYDRYWAAKTGRQPTPMPAGVVMEGGEAAVEDLVKTVERGLLVTRFWYIRVVNPQTLQLTGLTRDGLFLIEGGKLAGPVVNLRFNHSPVRLLEKVLAVGRAVRVRGAEGAGMLAPPVVSAEFTFTSISEAV